VSEGLGLRDLAPSLTESRQLIHEGSQADLDESHKADVTDLGADLHSDPGTAEGPSRIELSMRKTCEHASLPPLLRAPKHPLSHPAEMSSTARVMLASPHQRTSISISRPLWLPLLTQMPGEREAREGEKAQHSKGKARRQQGSGAGIQGPSFPNLILLIPCIPAGPPTHFRF
jgi:hypothetical protein